jgi:hypothetical protein
MSLIAVISLSISPDAPTQIERKFDIPFGSMFLISQGRIASMTYYSSLMSESQIDTD